MGLQVKYQTENGKWLCFKHAVKRALADEDIHTVVDEFGSEYDMRDTGCVDCNEGE